jgi:putative NADH-flavin reductase
MKLTIVAATGRIGRLLLDQAVTAGHDVTAVVRNPKGLPPGVRTVVADLTAAGPDVLEPAVTGADAVLSGLGPRSAADVGVVTTGTRSIVAAMRSTGVRRLVVVSASPIGTVLSPGRRTPRHDPGDGIVMRYVLTPLTKRVLRANYADLAMMEEIVGVSGLEWTVVRPPRLTDKPMTGTYRTALDRNVRRGLSVPRADVAHCMLHVLDEPGTIGRNIALAT